jgi:hypothetical protein
VDTRSSKKGGKSVQGEATESAAERQRRVGIVSVAHDMSALQRLAYETALLADANPLSD